MKCLCCGKLEYDLHHVKHRGAGGTDDEWNLMPLCRWAHQTVHYIGMKTFSDSHPEVKEWLLKNGWIFNEVKIKWTRY